MTQNLICDSASVEALNALHVKVLEDHRVAQVLVIAHLFQCQPGINIHFMGSFTEANDARPGEEQVNVNAVKAELKDRNAGGGNWTDVGHLVGQPEHL